MRHLIIVAGLILLLSVPVHGTTYLVKPDGTGDFPNIQAAIDAVVDGDIIALTEGTFTGPGNRDLDYMGKAITVMSEGGAPDACIIDCQGYPGVPRRGFSFCSGEGAESRLVGVTISNGHGGTGSSGKGGALWVSNCSSPSIENCVFAGNCATWGGAVFTEGHSDPAFSRCFFLDNTADQAGGAVSLTGMCFSVIEGCTFWANSSSGYSAALNCEMAAPTLASCTFVANSCFASGAIGLFDATALLLDTIIAFSPNCMAIMMEGGNAYLSCCDIYGNSGGDWVGNITGQCGLNGNICEDPLFCDPENGDFTLHCNSPCVPSSEAREECDLIGAWPVGCGSTPGMSATWGRIKALYHE